MALGTKAGTILIMEEADVVTQIPLDANDPRSSRIQQDARYTLHCCLPFESDALIDIKAGERQETRRGGGNSCLPSWIEPNLPFDRSPLGDGERGKGQQSDDLSHHCRPVAERAAEKRSDRVHGGVGSIVNPVRARRSAIDRGRQMLNGRAGSAR